METLYHHVEETDDTQVSDQSLNKQRLHRYGRNELSTVQRVQHMVQSAGTAWRRRPLG